MVTPEQVEKAMKENNITEVDHHACSLCGYMTKYERKGDDVYFDSGCGCTGGYNPEPRDFDDISDWINMQSNKEVKIRLAKRFGLIK